MYAYDTRICMVFGRCEGATQGFVNMQNKNSGKSEGISFTYLQSAPVGELVQPSPSQGGDSEFDPRLEYKKTQFDQKIYKCIDIFKNFCIFIMYKLKVFFDLREIIRRASRR